MAKPNKTLGDIGEDATIAALLKVIGGSGDALIGPGDDCAVVACGNADQEWQLTSDPVVEGIHFLPDTPPRRIGRKAVGRVLSDIAAMGGDPKWLVINITAPRRCEMRRLQDIYRGAQVLCRQYGAVIIGGDVGQGNQLALHVFGIGEAPRGTSVRRAGAQPGDALYVTGRLGGSWLGRHLTFEPRVGEGRWLRCQGWPTSMMDVSDGLATDLRRLVQSSGVGAELEASAIPISRAARTMNDGRSPLAHALGDGEDFELVFTVASKRCAEFERAWQKQFRLPCSRIGRIIPARREPRLFLIEAGRRHAWQGRGFEHFVSRIAAR